MYNKVIIANFLIQGVKMNFWSRFGFFKLNDTYTTRCLHACTPQTIAIAISLHAIKDVKTHRHYEICFFFFQLFFFHQVAKKLSCTDSLIPRYLINGMDTFSFRVQPAAMRSRKLTKFCHYKIDTDRNVT